MLKVDMMKAYDSIEWAYIEQILVCLNFPGVFINWIMQCLISVAYSIVINGKPSPLLQAKKGLRQGDPISPYLFVLAMEYLCRLLKQLKHDRDFKFHPRCAKLQVIQLGFADDLLLFSKGDVGSVQKLYGLFHKFSSASGLQANLQKSSIYFGGVREEVQQQILAVLGMTKGSLPSASSRQNVRKSHFLDCKTPLLCRKSAVTDVSTQERWWAESGESSVMEQSSYLQTAVESEQQERQIVGEMGTLILYKRWNYQRSKYHQASWIVKKILKASSYMEAAGLIVEEEIKVQTFSILRMYLKLMGTHPRVGWRNLICSNPCPPKWLFIGYLVANGRVYSKDRLINWGMDVDPLCQLCKGVAETMNHLFFTCPVAAAVWSKLLQWQGITRQCCEWPEECEWMEMHRNSNNSSSVIYRMTLAGGIYHIWKERNQVLFQGKRRSADTIVRVMVQDVFFRASRMVKLAGPIASLNFYPS
ncbi:uncharacterized protein LOC132061093 [Lycium ferocissimum]|uniref:uncharacterized protein LOC132061093 n=1 Tax=Lycium ferocissimum TaxID=112874 RepID=UPI0028156B40|nr:uncharacterized protein LOC132061093 [Lycium ferocissimum]